MTDKPNTELTSALLEKFEESLDALEPGMIKWPISAAKRSRELPKFELSVDGVWSLKLDDPVTYLQMFGGNTQEFCNTIALGAQMFPKEATTWRTTKKMLLPLSRRSHRMTGLKPCLRRKWPQLISQ